MPSDSSCSAAAHRRRELLTALAVSAAGCSSSVDESGRTPQDRPTPELVSVTVVDDDVGGFDTADDRLRITVSESELEPAGQLEGTGDPVDVHSDRGYPSAHKWAPPDGVEADGWMAAASIGPSDRERNRAGRIYFNRQLRRVSDWLVAHERGHNLGLRHSDDGLMDYRSPDIDQPGVSNATATIATHTEGLELLSWSDPDSTLVEAVEIWRRGRGVTTADLRWLAGVRTDDPDADRQTMYSNGVAEAIERLRDDVAIDSGGVYRIGNRVRPTDGTDAWR